MNIHLYESEKWRAICANVRGHGCHGCVGSMLEWVAWVVCLSRWRASVGDVGGVLAWVVC